MIRMSFDSITPDKATIQYDSERYLTVIRQDWMTDYACWEKTVADLRKLLAKWVPPPAPVKDSVEIAKEIVASAYERALANEIQTLYTYPFPPGGSGGSNSICSIGGGGSGGTSYGSMKEYFYVDSDGSIHKREKPKYKYKDFYSVSVGDIHNGWLVCKILRDWAYFSNTSGYMLTRDIIRERMLECKSTL